MRRIEHLVITVLLAALAALSYVHFRSPRPVAEAPPGAEKVEETPKAKSLPAREAASPDSTGETASGTVAPAPAPAETDDEQKARDYAAQRQTEAATAEQAQLDRLMAIARVLFGDGGPDALLWAGYPEPQTGSGNDDDLRRLVAEYGKETDPVKLWALAQRIRFHLTARRGSFWTIDEKAFQAFEQFGRDDADPYKRGFALGSAGSTHWGDENAFLRDRVLNDADPRLRAKAAGMLPAPKGLSEAEARPVADRYREMLDSPDARIRESAARAFGPWAFRDADVDRLIDVARNDPSTAVRVAAATSLGSCAFERARRALADISGDPAQPETVREAAKAALAGAGIIPGK